MFDSLKADAIDDRTASGTLIHASDPDVLLAGIVETETKVVAVLGGDRRNHPRPGRGEPGPGPL